jgi:hypothetical protein
MKKLSMIDITRAPEKTMPMPATPENRYAPTLYLEDVEGLADFPEEGMMLVKFKRTSLNVSSSKSGTRVSMSLEIPCICEVMPERAKEDKSEDVLDKLLAEASKEAMDRDDESEEDED